MTKWDALRRAGDNIRPNRSIKLFPSVVKVLIDEIRILNKEIDKIKRSR